MELCSGSGVGFGRSISKESRREIEVVHYWKAEVKLK